MVILTDAFREIKRSHKRFFSLLLLVMLAAAFLAGLRTTSPDMKYTAAKYFNKQALMDIQMVSSLGYSEKELQKAKDNKWIRTAEGVRETTLQTDNLVISVLSLPDKINKPYLTEGRLPKKMVNVL